MKLELKFSLNVVRFTAPSPRDAFKKTRKEIEKEKNRVAGGERAVWTLI